MFKNTISQDLQDDIRAIMEAGLHPNQQKIDVHEPEKDKITAHDFKKLRAMKKTKTEEHALESAEQVEEEEKKKIVSPFDYKNYTSQIPKKPGELTGHDSKKISTGTVYTKKPVKENTDIEEARKDKPLTLFKKDKRTFHPPKEESHQAATTMKHIPNASTALKKAAKDIKPGIAGYRDRIAMLKAGGVKEEVEELDELSKNTLGSYAKKASRDAVITRKIGADFEYQGKRAKSPGMKAASDELSQKYKSKSWQRRDGVDKAVDRLAKEEVELGEAKSLHKMSSGELDQAHKDNEAKIAAIHKNDPTVRITKSHPLISKRRSINLHKVIRSKQSNEEVEIDEGSGPKEKQKTPFRNINSPEYKAAADKQRQQMAKDKAAEPGKKMLDKKGMAEGWDDMLKANKERAVAADKAKGTGKFDKKELSPGSTQYTRKSKTFTDGGSDADLRKANRKSNEDVNETTIILNSFTVNLKETYTFGEYLQAAKNIVGEDEAVMMANKAFGAQDVGIFEQAITIENMIEEMNTLEEAGHSISEPKYNTELGNPYYEYTVTEETGARRKYIHHGDVVTN